MSFLEQMMCTLYVTNILQCTSKNVYKQLTVFSAVTYINISILQGNKHKMLSHLESNFKHRLILVDIRFGNEGISPG